MRIKFPYFNTRLIKTMMYIYYGMKLHKTVPNFNNSPTNCHNKTFSPVFKILICKLRIATFIATFFFMDLPFQTLQTKNKIKKKFNY